MADASVEFILSEEQPINADFELQPDVTFTADLKFETGKDKHNELYNRDLPDQHPMGAITGLDEALEAKVDKTDEILKVYGTDGGGDQTTYDVNSFGQVDDVQVGGTSVVTNKVASLGTMAGESTGDYYTKSDINDTVGGLQEQITANHDEIGRLGQTIGGYGDIVTHDASEFATSAQGALADTALQPNDNISELNNDVGYITSASIPTNYVTTDTAQTIGVQKAFSQPLVVADGVGVATGTILSNKKMLQKTSSGIEVGNSTEDILLVGKSATTNPKYNGNDLALKSDIPTMTAGTGIDITSNTVSVTDPTLVNNGTGTKALAAGKTSQSTAEGGVAVGYGAQANSTYGTAVGYESRASNTNTTVVGKQAKATQARAIAIGSGAEATAQDAIAIKGINNTANTFQVYTYTMLDMATGLIPDARINSATFATKNYVDDSVSTNTAYFDGSWATYADIPSTVAGFTNESLPEPTNNNYLVVLEDETQDGGTWRYKYVDDGGAYDKANWAVEYEVNETPLTQAQLDALNSGVTSADVSLAQSALQSGDNISTLNNDVGYITSSSLPTDYYTKSEIDDLIPQPTKQPIVYFQPTDSYCYDSSNNRFYGSHVTEKLYLVKPKTSGTEQVVDMSTTFSLEFSFDYLEAPTSAVDLAEIIASYSAGKGVFLQLNSTGLYYKNNINGTTVSGTRALTVGNSYDVKVEYDGTHVIISYKLSSDLNYTQANSTTCTAGGSNYNYVMLNMNTTYGDMALSSVTLTNGGSTLYSYVAGQIALDYDSSLTLNGSNQLKVVVDQTYDGTSINPQSGVAIAGAGFITGITSGDVTTALGYTPYNSTNPSGYITGITSGDVTTALGYTPYDNSNPSGYITGITSGDVTTALGYTPVNPTSLASVATSGLYSDLSGTPTVDQVYDGTSANAQSGVAINGELANYATTADLATKQDSATALTTTNTYYSGTTLYIG